MSTGTRVRWRSAARATGSNGCRCPVEVGEAVAAYLTGGRPGAARRGSLHGPRPIPGSVSIGGPRDHGPGLPASRPGNDLFEIDLNAGNVQAFREEFALFTEHARKRHQDGRTGHHGPR